ncbi:MAG: aminopeptidase P family protein [Proteobacteria bacterium]|nr:aminopeptidase P family protein [Pseudomonadota bacterium]
MITEANLPLTVDQVQALAPGAAAAPDGIEPDAWLALVGDGLANPGSPPERRRLAAALSTLKAAIRAAWGAASPPPAAERLNRLREAYKGAGVSAFVVPRNDEHQGEYVPARAERLAWLTGFTGSAGVAIVTLDRAAIFVDGRYTLQAADEVDAGLFELHHSAATTPGDWLKDALRAGDRLGFDPWLHTGAGRDRLETACRKAGASLAPLEANPLDSVWTGQPPPPLSPVVAHDERFTGEAAGARLGRVAQSLKESGADAAFLGQPDAIAWALNIRGADVPFSPLPLSFALVHADASADLMIDGRKLLSATRAHLGDAVRIHEPGELGRLIDGLGAAGRALLVDTQRTPCWVDARARAAGARIVAGDDPTVLPKACKTAAELDGARAAHRRDGVALTRLLYWIATDALAEGAGELDVVRRLDAERARCEHFRGPSFPTISGAGPNGAIVHYRASAKSERKLEAGTLLLLDSGGQYLDGTTDVTRTVALGAPDDEMRDRFTRVLKGHIAIATARFPHGTSGGQLDGMARRPLWDAGLDYDHGTGHGVGSYLNVHEGPQRIARGVDAIPLKAGMIVSNEPGYYKTGAYGIRIENLVAIVAAPRPPGAERDLLACETLTLAPFDRTLIVTAMLTNGERAWVDAYHRRVQEVLSSDLEPPIRAWLAAATRPL